MKRNCHGSYKLYLIIVTNIMCTFFFYTAIYLIRKVKEHILTLVALKYWFAFHFMILNSGGGGGVPIPTGVRKVHYISPFLKSKGNPID